MADEIEDRPEDGARERRDALAEMGNKLDQLIDALRSFQREVSRLYPELPKGMQQAATGLDFCSWPLVLSLRATLEQIIRTDPERAAVFTEWEAERRALQDRLETLEDQLSEVRSDADHLIARAQQQVAEADRRFQEQVGHDCRKKQERLKIVAQKERAIALAREALDLRRAEEDDSRQAFYSERLMLRTTRARSIQKELAELEKGVA
jgi:hypothetical protein